MAMARAKHVAGTGRKVPPTRVHVGWYASLGVLLFAIGLSGLVVVENAQQMRGLYESSGKAQSENDAELAEFSRLRLEVGALTSLPNIERVARGDLDMEFPENVEQVLD
jgi:cell division protein FtsL